MAEAHELEKITAREYTEEQVDTALLALALNGGQITQTIKDLAAGGVKVPETTLRGWMESYPNRYRYHLTENAAKAEGRAVSGYLSIIQQAQAVTLQAIARQEDELRKGNVRDPSGVARNMAVVSGVANTHMMNLQGRPSIITEHRKPEDIARRLKELGMTFDVESTALPSEPPSALEG